MTDLEFEPRAGRPDGFVQIPEEEALRTFLKQAISYEVPLSIDGHPQITRGYRTDADAQALLDGLVPIVQRILDEQQQSVIEWLERRSRWADGAAQRGPWWAAGRRGGRDFRAFMAAKAVVADELAVHLRAQARRWWSES